MWYCRDPKKTKGVGQKGNLITEEISHDHKYDKL